MNAFEYFLIYNELQNNVNSISKEAYDLAVKTFGKHPINDTIDELRNPSGVSIEDAIFCQELLNTRING